jgi:hypothetical protein
MLIHGLKRPFLFVYADVLNLFGLRKYFARAGKGGPSVFCAFLNEKTLDYLFDNQAVVGFVPPSVFLHFIALNY